MIGCFEREGIIPNLYGCFLIFLELIRRLFPLFLSITTYFSATHILCISGRQVIIFSQVSIDTTTSVCVHWFRLAVTIESIDDSKPYDVSWRLAVYVQFWCSLWWTCSPSCTWGTWDAMLCMSADAMLCMYCRDHSGSQMACKNHTTIGCKL